MTPWLRIRPGEYATVQHRTEGTNTYSAVTSPFDIPRAVRAFVVKASQILVLEFQYLVEERLEPKEVEHEGCKMTLWRGVNSKRLRRIEIHLQSIQVNSRSEIGSIILKTVEMLGDEPALVAAPEVAGRIVSDNSDKLATAAA